MLPYLFLQVTCTLTQWAPLRQNEWIPVFVLVRNPAIHSIKIKNKREKVCKVDKKTEKRK